MSNLIQLGSVNGYIATPNGNGPWPAVIVIQEWWGLDAQTKSIADRFAQEGYLAFAPDLYHGELAQLGDGDTAMKLVQKYGPNAYLDLQSLFDALMSHPDCNGKIGSVGFCFGGRMSLTLGISRPLNAICTFYGGGMQTIFDLLRTNLKAPVLGLFGDADVSIPAGTVEEFDKLLDEVGVEHEVIMYPNSGHAFFRDSDPQVYIPDASKDAWERVNKFFHKHLN
ncbi:dienelactone hydrolase family protein [Candidatus Villigracilis saccharophilus]|uniref:dienelactone hydrolase family protein n=1 Tax=Candidatus Villigracilis saccharophilus TaxID=3140684 RepID=UPI003136D3F7|nr:dienelactone hydrolase family protein [Anaerolineales bacterium]